MTMTTKSLLFVRNIVYSSQNARKFSNLKEQLRTLIPTKRQELKQFRVEYGKRILGTVSVEDCIEGGKDIPVIFSQFGPHYGNDSTLKQFVQTATDVPKTYETFLLYLLLRRFPTATEMKEFKQDLNQRRNKFNLSTLKLHKNFPPGFHQSRLLSLNFMELQPHSKFYQHRKETLKQSHWEWILEDILDIIAIFPPLLHQMVYPQDPLPKKSLSYAELMALTSPDSFITIEATPPPAPAANSKSPKKPSSTAAATVATPASPAATQPFPSKSVQDAVDRYLIENTILDGGHPIVHAMRLVNCTLTDPYLAVAAGITANSALRRHDLFLGTRYMKLSAHLIGGLMEIFWDRALLHPLENPKSVEIPFLTKFLQISDKEME